MPAKVGDLVAEDSAHSASGVNCSMCSFNFANLVAEDAFLKRPL